jgi:hypothetical protein
MKMKEKDIQSPCIEFFFVSYVMFQLVKFYLGKMFLNLTV